MHIQNVVYLSIVTTQQKTNARKASNNEGKNTQARRRVRCVLMIGKGRGRTGTSGAY